jgi:RND family efflux transporter MFP subunit
MCILVLAVLGCGEEAEEQPVVTRPVKMLTLGAGATATSVEYPGSVAAVQNAEMAFEVPGRITEFRFREGQAVNGGQVLALLDPRDYEASRDAEEAGRNQARAEYRRYQELYAENAVSLQDLEARQRGAEVANARLRQAQKAVDDTRLIAPFSGVMARKLVQDFQNVQAKQPVLILQDESSLEIVVNVPESDVVLAVPGLSPQERTARTNPQVELSSLSGRRFPARFQEFSATADPVTRTFPVTFAFDAPADVAVRSGMTAKVILTPPRVAAAAQATTFSIPANAVLSDEGGSPYVWKVDESTMTVSRAPVVVGTLSGSEIVVQSGLVSGDVIAVTGVHQLREGLVVRRLED